MDGHVCVSVMGHTSLLWDTPKKLRVVCYEQYERTALMLAALKGRHEFVSILVANGAEVNAVSKVGSNANRSYVCMNCLRAIYVCNVAVTI